MYLGSSFSWMNLNAQPRHPNTLDFTASILLCFINLDDLLNHASFWSIPSYMFVSSTKLQLCSKFVTTPVWCTHKVTHTREKQLVEICAVYSNAYYQVIPTHVNYDRLRKINHVTQNTTLVNSCYTPPKCMHIMDKDVMQTTLTSLCNKWTYCIYKISPIFNTKVKRNTWYEEKRHINNAINIKGIQMQEVNKQIK